MLLTSALIESGNLRELAQLHKVALRQMELSEEQLSVLDRYCYLANLIDASEAEINELTAIWEKAESDQSLTRALALIDEFQLKPIQEEKLLADDGDLRTFLSEYVPVEAESKLKQLYNHRDQVQPDSLCLVMLCPNGSGFVQKSFPKEGYLDLNKACEVCDVSLFEHRGFIAIGGGTLVTK
jgi:hypothetical protein